MGTLGTKMALANLFQSGLLVTRIAPLRQFVEKSWLVFQKAFPSFCKLEVRSFSLSQLQAKNVSSALKRPLLTVPLPPKKPLVAYTLFVKEKFHGVLLNCDKNETVTKIAELWHELPAAEREVYDTKGVSFSEKYKEDVRRFLENEIGSKAKQQEYFLTLKKYRSDMRKYKLNWRLRTKGLLKPSSINCYNTYVREKCAELPIGERKQFALVRKEEWHTMSTITKKIYFDRAEGINRENFKKYEERMVAAGMSTDVAKKGKDKSKTVSVRKGKPLPKKVLAKKK